MTTQRHNWLRRWVIASLLDAIRLYRAVLSPFFGTQCRFQPTCSAYAEQALQEHGIAKGLWLTLNRLRRCHPIRALGASPDGFTYDPVPPHAQTPESTDSA